MNEIYSFLENYEATSCDDAQKSGILQILLELSKYDFPLIQENALSTCMMLLEFKDTFENAFLENDFVEVCGFLLFECELSSDSFILIVNSLGLILTISKDICFNILEKIPVRFLIDSSLKYSHRSEDAISAVAYYSAESIVKGVFPSQAFDILEAFEKSIEKDIGNSASDIISRFHYMIEDWPDDLDLGILHHHGIIGLINSILSESEAIEDVHELITFAIDCITLMLQKHFIPEINFDQIIFYTFNGTTDLQKSSFNLLAELFNQIPELYQTLITNEYFHEIFEYIKTKAISEVKGHFVILLFSYLSSLEPQEINKLILEDIELIEYFEEQLQYRKYISYSIKSLIICIDSSKSGDFGVRALIHQKIVDFDGWDELEDNENDSKSEVSELSSQLLNLVNSELNEN